jgi:uncharacterized protein YjiS (DUF1127 family)
MIGAIAKAAPKSISGSWVQALGRTGRHLAVVLVELRRAAQERAQLLSLDERELRDIGITRLDAIREADRPLSQWRSP